MRLIIIKAEQYHDHESDQPLQSVHYEIVDENGEQLMERVQSYPLSAGSEEIKADLARALEVYKDAVARHEGAKALQAGINNASQVGEEITGLEIN